MSRVEAKVQGADRLRRAMSRIPGDLRVEILNEMTGRDGLGVDYKRAIAKTAVPSRGSKRGFEKWLYSTSGPDRDQQLTHDVRNTLRLDQLTLAVGTRPSAAIAERGGVISTKTKDKLLIPLGRTQTERRNNRRLIELSPDTFAFSRRGPGGRVFVAVRDQRLRITTRTRADGKRDRYQYAGESNNGVKILAELRDKARRRPGRLNFFGAVNAMRATTDRRFGRALDRAIKNFERRR